MSQPIDGGSSKSRLALLRESGAAAFPFVLFVLGFWALEQTMFAVAILGRDYVNLPFGPATLDVWTYHDIAYSLIWLAYVGVVAFEALRWRPFRFTVPRVLVSLFGFAVVTAGLWLSQDMMNSVLVLGRGYVDMPFYVARPDLLNTMSLVTLLVPLGFISFFALVQLIER